MTDGSLHTRVCIRCLRNAIGGKGAISFAKSLMERGLVGRTVSFSYCFKCRGVCSSGRLDDHSIRSRVYGWNGVGYLGGAKKGFYLNN